MIKQVDIHSAQEALELAQFYQEHYDAPEYLKPTMHDLMFSNKTHFKYVKDGKIVGATSCFHATPYRLETWSTLVHPNNRRQGIASKFNEYIEDYARKYGFGVIYCHIYTDNEASIEAKKKAGYEIVATLPDYDEEGKDDHILRKVL